jgi:hypothetical protein
VDLVKIIGAKRCQFFHGTNSSFIFSKYPCTKIVCSTIVYAYIMHSLMILLIQTGFH